MLAGACRGHRADRDRDRGHQTTTPATRSSPRRWRPRCTSSARAATPSAWARLRPALRRDGPAAVTGAQMADAVGIYRRLWHGEGFGHNGPAGEYLLLPGPHLRRGRPGPDDGDRGELLRLAGRLADGVVLHTFLTDETLARAVATIRAAAEQAAATPRPCGSGRCSPPSTTPSRRRTGSASWSAGSPPTSRVRRGAGPRQRVVARDLARFRAHTPRPGLPGRLRRHRHRRGAHPVARGGAARALARRVRDRDPEQCARGPELDAGADSVVLHGATPGGARGRRARGEVRDPARDALPANPGWVRR